MKSSSNTAQPQGLSSFQKADEERSQHKLMLQPVVEIDAKDIDKAIRKGQPFIVRNWINSTDAWTIDSSNWEKFSRKVTVVPPDTSSVAYASYMLRRLGMTVDMTFRELFNRIEGKENLNPLVREGERYYLFGGAVPEPLLDSLAWPKSLQYGGASMYVASSDVTAKAHYDKWWAFLVQLHGSKTVKLFPPSDYSYIYPTYGATGKTPRRALVDLDNPNLSKFPLLSSLHGQVAKLQTGDMLFLPIHWWHEVTSEEFSVGLNRRLKRGTLAWTKAFFEFSFHILKGRYLHGIKPLPIDDINSVAVSVRKSFSKDFNRIKKKIR